MSPIDDYTYLDETSAKKVAYAIKLIFGVEFAWEIIVADTRVNRLSKRVSFIYIIHLIIILTV
jgi:phosphatidylethanolamine N-methyltransferase